MEFSVIIPVYNREKHLLNLLRGIARGQVKPAEIIIVNMGDQIHLSGFAELPVKIVQLPMERGQALPLSKARNWGARSAITKTLFFLDVDCIPSTAYFNTLITHFKVYDGLIMGTPNYLIKPIKSDCKEADLRDLSIAHPYRPIVKDCALSHDPGLFWSLCFVISKSLLNKIGGFDEHYIGYGGEDTDFAFSVREKGFNFFISEAVVFHQQHAVYSPPLHKFDEIVQNSKVFYKKWGLWPMGNWLQTFCDLALIDWAPHYKKIIVLQAPKEKHLQSSYRANAAFM